MACQRFTGERTRKTGAGPRDFTACGKIGLWIFSKVRRPRPCGEGANAKSERVSRLNHELKRPPRMPFPFFPNDFVIERIAFAGDPSRFLDLATQFGHGKLLRRK